MQGRFSRYAVSWAGLLGAVTLVVLVFGVISASAHEEESLSGAALPHGGRFPGEPDIVRVGGSTYRFDVGSAEYVIHHEHGPTTRAHADFEPRPNEFADVGLSYNLPSQEEAPICREGGHRIVPVFTLRPGDSTATPTAQIRSVIRRMTWRLSAAAFQSSGGTKSLKSLVDCEPGSLIRVRRLTTESRAPATIFSALKQAYGAPSGSSAVKYLAFDREEGNGVAGVSESLDDASKSSSNLSDTTTTGSVVYAGKGLGTEGSYMDNWERYTSLHELLHAMGAVQGAVAEPSPFSTPGHHCLDGVDVMCYDDGTKSGYSETRCSPLEGYNTPTTIPVDCGGDTYFNVNPTAGSWLAQHWNVAGPENAFLVDPNTVLGTTTTAHLVEALNGNPGWATIDGNVTANNGASTNGMNVNVTFKKRVNGQWETIETVQRSIANGHYEVVNFRPGKGEWKVRTVFPAQGGLPESASESEPEFTIKDGYRLVARHSGKCLDVYGAYTANGTGMIQYECGNPTTSQNQVFTLVPQGSAYYQLIARHSGRCVDVTNLSQSDGARLQQWDCLGSNQTNQIWQGVPYGPAGYSHFVAKHSGKCMDVEGASQNNIAAVNQWTCGSGTNQQWTLQSVESGPIPTHASLTVNSTLNGQPGFINVSGNVDAGAYSLGGQFVNVNFQREVSPGNWETVENETLHVNLNGENHYAWETWAIGTGQWRTRVVYPGNTPYAGSESEYHYFQIKSGYRLINRYSNKCMSLSENKNINGQAIIQWDCSGNPNPNDGQVFTLVPKGGGYYDIEINSTDKCVDVTGASTSDGAWLQQYQCLGAGQANQLWQNVELANQPGWFAFIAKHSGKCADLTGPSGNNGVRIQQWSCHWGSNQQWRFEAIN